MDTQRKWLFLEPTYILTIAPLACFNYLFDQAFKGLVLLNPKLAFLYIFQYIFIIPTIDTAILQATSLFSKRSRKLENGA